MKPTDQLKDEHKGIKLMLQILGKICEQLEARIEINADHLEKIIDFFKVFVDQCHHGKEENLLFPAMEDAGIPREGGPIEVLLLEHEQGRKYVRIMNEALGNYWEDASDTSSSLVVNSRSYIDLLTKHIEKEDTVLFPLADSHLLQKKQKELLQGFEKIELERIGIGKHEEFHRLLDTLEVAYLGNRI